METYDQDGNLSNANENVDSINDTVVEPTDNTVDATEELKAQRDRLYARLKEQEEINKRLKASVSNVKINPRELDEVKSVKDTVSRLELAEKKRQFGYEYGLSPEETDKVFQINPNPSKETLDDSFVKGGLEAIRAKKKLSENTPSASTGSTTFAADKDLEEMKPAEKQAEFEKFMAAKGLK